VHDAEEDSIKALCIAGQLKAWKLPWEPFWNST